MSNLRGLYFKAEKFTKRNSATILTVAGSVGVVATMATTIKATTKASKLLTAAEEAKGEELTSKEMAKLILPSYITPILFGVATITCIFGANALNKQKQASLIGAYTLLDSSFKEYKNKVNELYGDSANDQIVESTVKEQCPRRSS